MQYAGMVHSAAADSSTDIEVDEVDVGLPAATSTRESSLALQASSANAVGVVSVAHDETEAVEDSVLEKQAEEELLAIARLQRQRTDVALHKERQV